MWFIQKCHICELKVVNSVLVDLMVYTQLSFIFLATVRY